MQTNTYTPIPWDSIHYTHDWTGNSTYECVETQQNVTEDYSIAYRNFLLIGLLLLLLLLFIHKSIDN